MQTGSAPPRASRCVDFNLIGGQDPNSHAALHFAGELDALPEDARADRLAELNVVAQIESIARTDVVRDAWRSGQPLALHGWIFCIRDGLLRDLHVSRSGPDAAP